MDQFPATTATSRREMWTVGLRAAAQIVVSIVVLGTVYFLIPAKGGISGSDLPWLILALCLFAVVVAIQIPAILNARHPILRAAVAIGVLLPLYLIVFARVYLSTSLSDPGSFTEPLNHATALYFTVTVFATVGFGDIVAKTDSIRLLVTAHMLLNLVIVGAVIRLLVFAARRGIQRGLHANHHLDS